MIVLDLFRDVLDVVMRKNKNPYLKTFRKHGVNGLCFVADNEKHLKEYFYNSRINYKKMGYVRDSSKGIYGSKSSFKDSDLDDRNPKCLIYKSAKRVMEVRIDGLLYTSISYRKDMLPFKTFYEKGTPIIRKMELNMYLAASEICKKFKIKDPTTILHIMDRIEVCKLNCDNLSHYRI